MRLLFVLLGATFCLKTATADEVPVTWTHVTTRKKVEDEIRAHRQQVIIMFSATRCKPCKLLKKWWERQRAPSEWHFVYWEANNGRQNEAQHAFWRERTGGDYLKERPSTMAIYWGHPTQFLLWRGQCDELLGWLRSQH